MRRQDISSIPESGARQAVLIRVPADLHRTLRHHLLDQRSTLNAFFLAAVMEKLSREVSNEIAART